MINFIKQFFGRFPGTLEDEAGITPHPQPKMHKPGENINEYLAAVYPHTRVGKEEIFISATRIQMRRQGVNKYNKLLVQQLRAWGQL